MPGSSTEFASVGSVQQPEFAYFRESQFVITRAIRPAVSNPRGDESNFKTLEERLNALPFLVIRDPEMIREDELHTERMEVG